MKYLIILVCLIIAVASIALATYKPSRVLFPQINGLSCNNENICIDEMEQLPKAYELVKKSKIIVSHSLGKLDFKPKFIFCSTQNCFESFGFSKAAAINIGKSGTIIGPRGWMQHIVTHELIHQWQNYQYGIFSVLFAEEWMIEGMAYALSNDPREKLSEPWQSYRQQYIEWQQLVDQYHLVSAIKKEL